MTTRIGVLACVALLTLAACSNDSGNDEGGFTFGTTVPTTTFGDGDGDTAETGTATGDGDGSPGDGDGDGDGAPTSCGDGVVDPGEQCDLGPQNSDSGQCTSSCNIAACGDGLVYEGFEECDDGNPDNTDACVQGCALAVCGDGYTQAGVEMCDDGNIDETDGCTTTCVPAVCGDGIVQAGEQCDDANDITSDNCPACQLAYCGDGYIQAGVEVCDDGNLENTDACIAPTCVEASCGDGHLQAGVEDCDDGNLDDSDSCPGSCMPSFCGDGYTQDGFEECDDGNNVSNDGCTADCISECGTDCWGVNGCLTAAGRCVRLSCRPGDAGATWCDSCMGWTEVTYDQWLNQGYCTDVIAKYRELYNYATACGNAPSCCMGQGNCGGGDNAWHFMNGNQNFYTGPCLGCQGAANCTYWNNAYTGTYTRISVCERNP
jgi:cysteine-rich repeat protein